MSDKEYPEILNLDDYMERTAVVEKGLEYNIWKISDKVINEIENAGQNK